MHCKFLVSLLIVFLCFSFFSSTCEFQLIERIGTHGKQNPDFIINFFFPGILLFFIFINVYVSVHEKKKIITTMTAQKQRFRCF